MKRIVIEDQSFVWNDKKENGTEKCMRYVMHFFLSR